MKSFSKIISEVAHKARSAEEQRFVDQHKIEVIKHPVAPESQFSGEIENLPKKKRLADYTKGQDATSYDKAYSVKESSEENNDMLVRQLHYIQYAAEEIIEFLEEDGGTVENWYENKIAVIFDSIQSLHAYAEGDKIMSKIDDEKTAYAVDSVYDNTPYSYNEGYDLAENYKTGNLTLSNKDVVKVSPQDAKLLNDLFKNLEPKNKKNFEEILMSDKAGFGEIVGFAREAV